MSIVTLNKRRQSDLQQLSPFVQRHAQKPPSKICSVSRALGNKMNEEMSQIDNAEKAFAEGDFDLLRDISPPLLEKNIAAAVRINASFFGPEVPEEECDRLYVEGMFKAAELGDLKAKYQVGAENLGVARLADLGALGNVEEAAQRAARNVE